MFACFAFQCHGLAVAMIGKVLNWGNIFRTGLLSGAVVAAAEPSTPRYVFDDFLLAPVRVHLLAGPEASHLSTTLTGADVSRILGKINLVWAQAGLQFYLESLVTEEPRNAELFPHPEMADGFRWMLELRPRPSQSNNVIHLYYVKHMPGNGVYLGEAIFVKDTASLKPVPGGIDEPIPRVTAHELGHALDLEHRQNVTNLMASGTTGTGLNDEEIRRAREAAGKYAWIETAAQAMKKAEELERAKQFKESKAWYRRLAALPVKSDLVERAKQRARE